MAREKILILLLPAIRSIVGMKFYRLYQQTRRQWIADNRPAIGRFICAICQAPIRSQDLTIDHIIRWKDSIDLRIEPTNFQAAHRTCNTFRGEVMENASYLVYIRSLPKDDERRAMLEHILANTQEAYKQFELRNKEA